MGERVFFPLHGNTPTDDSQYGFRPGHSTEYAAIELSDRIISAMDKNMIPLNIYLDLSKAFDTLDHAILLDKFFHYGIRGNPLKLISSYLENRQQCVEFRNTKSNIMPISTGVPHGSILGPLLFLIYINDFPSASSYFNFIMYADDTTLYSNIDSPNQNDMIRLTETKINAELAKIDEWLKINKLSLNLKKSKYMFFFFKNKHNKYKLNTNNESSLITIRLVARPLLWLSCTLVYM